MSMMISAEELTSILKEVKNQFINVSLRDYAGKWSDLYWEVDDIVTLSGPKDELLLMRSPITDDISVVRLSSITGIRFNKYLQLAGEVFSAFEITRLENLAFFNVAEKMISE